MNGNLAVPLREHLESQLAAERRLSKTQWRAHHAVHKELQRALKLAREQVALKHEEMNEIRDQIAQERSVYASRADLASAVREITTLITAAQTSADNAQAAAKSTRDQAAVLIFVIGLGFPIALKLLFGP